MSSDTDSRDGYASPPCFAHELDGDCGRIAAVDGETWRDVMRWRKAERQRLYRLRESMTNAQRERAQQIISAALDRQLAEHRAVRVAVYLPIHGEPDLRQWMRQITNPEIELALPTIAAENQPLNFVRWQPGAPLQPGRWGIAEPITGEPIEPELLIVPLPGVDKKNFRLGNGGGYYDRTLAAASPRPLSVGVGYHAARIETIYPLPHDIPMDVIITG